MPKVSILPITIFVLLLFTRATLATEVRPFTHDVLAPVAGIAVNELSVMELATTQPELIHRASFDPLGDRQENDSFAVEYYRLNPLLWGSQPFQSPDDGEGSAPQLIIAMVDNGLDQAGLISNRDVLPYMDARPDQAWFDRICGPRSTWLVLEYGPGRSLDPQTVELSNLSSRIPKDASAVVKVWPDYDGNGQIKPYIGSLKFKSRRCVEVQGQVDAQGRRPWITSGLVDKKSKKKHKKNPNKNSQKKRKKKLKGGSISLPTQGQPEIQNRGLIVKNMEVSGSGKDCVSLGNKARLHHSRFQDLELRSSRVYLRIE